jgi:DNA-binding transcriptional LysR family regulator
VPCFLAESEPDLQIVHPPIPELDKGLWILTHDDLRYVARVRTFIDFVAGAIAPHRELLEGRKRGCELGEG